MNYTTANLSISCKWVVRYHVWRRNHLWHYLDWDSLTKECVVIFAQDLSVNTLSLEILSALGGKCKDTLPPLILSRPGLGCFFLAVL